MFTKKHSDQNTAMDGRAEQLLRDAGYDPANTPHGSWEHRQWLRPYVDTAESQLRAEFPGVPPDRIRGRIARARTRIYSLWVKTR